MKIYGNSNKGAQRSAFTLVELLLVISIIAILASLGVGVMAQAQQDAAEAATRSRISLIEKILEVELEDYEVRRSPVPFSTLVDIVNASTLTDRTTRQLVHVKNLKRMLIADLIRAEMPDGSLSTNSTTPANQFPIGQFPTPSMIRYLNEIGVSNPEIDASALNPVNAPYTVIGWNDWADRPAPSLDWIIDGEDGIVDTVLNDRIYLNAADRSELLYQTLLNIDIDGVPAVDQIGSVAIGDTDDDGFLEVLDGWGEPMFLQWQQEWLTLDFAASPGSPTTAARTNVWNPGAGMAGLSREHVSAPSGTDFGQRADFDYIKPVLPSQIRPFLTSERLVQIDGFPPDYLIAHTF